MSTATADATSDTRRNDREIFDATRPFAKETRAKSWSYVLSTFLILIGVLSIAAVAPRWPLQLVASLVGGLLLVRAFILYHDFMHGSILTGSWVARALFYSYGCAVATPPSSWRETHNYHHANVARLGGPSVGSFPIMTVEDWRRASRTQRLRYRISRHALTILLAYLTVFLISICLVPFFQRPRKHWDSILAVLAQAGLIASLWLLLGPGAAFFGFIFPLWIASALGAYLFYAQHNFVGVKLIPSDDWTYYRAALESSSCLKLGPVLSWFTGDIGYHHVHHLNSKIPFYRLREAMEAIPELQKPVVTSLRPRDVLACLRLDLWDSSKGRMISFREAEGA